MDNLVIFCAKYLIFVVILVVISVWFLADTKTKKQLAIAVIAAGIAALILDKLAGALYFHHRPFVVNNVQPLIPHGNDNGFPSEHTLLASTLATIIYFYRRQIGLAMFGLAIIVGTGRVLAHVHWVIDVVGGLILGILAGYIGHVFAQKLFPSSEKTIVNQIDNKK